jgi:hypothetical protein
MLFALLFFIITGVWYLCKGTRWYRIKEGLMHFEPKILVLIIYSDNNQRWVYQHEQYLKIIKLNKHNNVHFKFIQCKKELKNQEDANHLFLECSESYVPGTLLKTILAMNRYKNQYDYVLRTNISTYTDIHRLVKMIEHYEMKISSDSPLYSGGIKFDWGISGTSILMNRKAANILLDELIPQYENVSKQTDADDVVIGSVLKKYMQYDDQFGIYIWDYNKKPDENIQIFSQHRMPFIRLKPQNDDTPSKMDDAYDKIINWEISQSK